MRSKKNKKKLIIAVTLAIVVVFIIINMSNGQKAAVMQQQATIAELNKKIIESQKNQSTTTKGDKINAVVAALDIKAGDIFSQESLKLQEFSKEELPPENTYFKSIPMLVGKKASKNIAPGGFVTVSDIQVLDVGAIEIPNDARAVTIPASKFKGVASYIKVGTKVDLLLDGSPPEYVAQNVKIVSFEGMNSQISPTDPNSINKIDSGVLTATNASAITFLIPIDLVPKVLSSSEKGLLQLITRNNNDEKIVIKEEELPPPPEETNINTLPSLPEEEATKANPLTKEAAGNDTPAPEPEAPQQKARDIEFIQAGAVSTLSPIGSGESSSKPSSGEVSSDFDKKLKNLLDKLN